MPTRYNDPGHAHYLTFSCHNRLKLFKELSICELFISNLERIRCQTQTLLWAYVIMPDHVHLLIDLQDKLSVSKYLQSLKKTVSYQAIRWIQENKPRWIPYIQTVQRGKSVFRFWLPGGGYDRNIYGDQTLLKTMNYIHNNPVRAGLVEKPTDWKWSSAKFWEFEEPDPIRLDIPPWWSQT